jgi:hypothetical protein
MDHRSDENLPEVVPNPSPTFPEVVVNTGAEQQQRHLAEQEKYPAYFDDAPKLLHEQHNHDGNQRPRDNSATAYSPDGHALPWEPLRAGDDTTLGANSNSGANDEPKICGVRRRIFWLILAFALVVVATGVGGGVGGAVASARAREGSGTGNPATTSSSSGRCVHSGHQSGLHSVNVLANSPCTVASRRLVPHRAHQRVRPHRHQHSQLSTTRLGRSFRPFRAFPRSTFRATPQRSSRRKASMT